MRKKNTRGRESREEEKGEREGRESRGRDRGEHDENAVAVNSKIAYQFIEIFRDGLHLLYIYQLITDVESFEFEVFET